MADSHVDPLEAVNASQVPAANIASSMDEAEGDAAKHDWLALVAALPSMATHEEILGASDVALGERAGDGPH